MTKPCRDWICCYLLRPQLGWNDALMIKAAYEGEAEVSALSPQTICRKRAALQEKTV